MTYFQVGSGDVVGSTHMNTAINQGVVPFPDAGSRDAAIPSPTPGMMCYLLSTMSLQTYTGSGWVGNPPAGTISAHAGAAAPPGWLLCDGALVSRAAYTDLFAVIGSAYGADDGSSTFALPDLKARIPVGVAPAITDLAVLGAYGGEREHALSLEEMPAHAHYHGAADGNWVAYPTTSGPANPTTLYLNFGETNPTSYTGGGANGTVAHNIMQWYVTVHWIIKT